jgi:Thioredoxin like C-terminal domain
VITGVESSRLRAGATDVGTDLVTADARGAEVAADWDELESPERYLGSARTANFASSGGVVRGASRVYAGPARLQPNHWALGGTWMFESEAVVLNAAGGRIAYQFHARYLHLVMGPSTAGTAVQFQVLIDGHPLGPAHGFDVDDEGTGTLAEQCSTSLSVSRCPSPSGDSRSGLRFTFG